MRTLFKRAFAVLLGGIYALCRALRPPTLPRVIRHNEHPWMRRMFGKVVAGGGGHGSILTRLLGTLAYACLVASFVAGGMAVTSALVASDSGAVLAMPGLAAAVELRQERAQLAEQARAIVDKAEEEGRDLSDEENSSFDRMHEESEALKRRIDRIEQQEELESELRDSTGTRAGRFDTDDDDPPEGRDDARERDKRWVRAARAWMLQDTPRARVSAEDHQLVSELGGSRLHFPLRLYTGAERHRYLRDRERRALAAGVDAAGGFTVPEGFRNRLEEAMVQFGGMRRVRTEILRTATGNDLPMPTSDDTGNAGALLAENTQDAEQDVTFGQVVLGAYKYTSKIIRVSIEMLQDTAIDLEDFLGRKLGERIGRITNTHFTTGSGAAQPNGLVTAVGVGKQGAGGQVATVTYDDLVDLEHSVDRAYRDQAEYMFSDLTLAALRKLKDADGRPLWQAGLTTREPDRVNGYRYEVNNDVPDMAASAKSILFGDMSKYVIRDVLDITLSRLVERYAEFHQVAFVAISRHDGDLVDAGAGPIKAYQNAAA